MEEATSSEAPSTSEPAVVKTTVVEVKIMEKWDAETYLKTLSRLMVSKAPGSIEQMSKIVADCWERTDIEESGYFSPPCDIDRGTGARMAASSNNLKRIAGTQRTNVPQPPIKKRPIDVPAEVPKLVKKVQKKVAPIIDDSISNATDKPCNKCNGVSETLNSVIQCESCDDAVHMKCNEPQITMEQASDARFIFRCTKCSVNAAKTVAKPSTIPQVMLDSDRPEKKGKVDKNRVKNLKSVYQKKYQEKNAAKKQES